VVSKIVFSNEKYTVKTPEVPCKACPNPCGEKYNPLNADCEKWSNPTPFIAELIGADKPNHFARSVAHQPNHLRVAKKIQKPSH
jgi:hypothetical protein